jgi:hypothetical protein
VESVSGDGAAAVGTGFGAAPVVSRDAPTDDNPPLGRELEPSELENADDGDEPMGEMPLIYLDYHSAARSCLSSKHL